MNTRWFLILNSGFAKRCLRVVFRRFSRKPLSDVLDLTVLPLLFLCLTCIDRLFILAGAAILGLSPPSQILSSSTDDSGLLAASCLPRLGHLLRKSQRGFAPDSQRSSAGHSKGSGCRP